MKERQIEGVFINTQKTLTEATIATVDGENFLDDVYAKLDCEYVDCATRYINGKEIDIWCDDNGHDKENRPAIYTIRDGKCVEMIVGNVFLCSHDKDGNSISLTNDEKKAVLNAFIPSEKGGEQIVAAAFLDPYYGINGISYKELKAREVVNKVVDYQYKMDTFEWDPKGMDEIESAYGYVKDLMNDDNTSVEYTLTHNCGDPDKKENFALRQEALDITLMFPNAQPDFSKAQEKGGK